jgi:hypothetical protein
MLSAIRHIARWLAWQVGENDDSPADLALASITVFSTGHRRISGV